MTNKKELVYMNGVLAPKEEAKVSVFDRGFLYGDGVFETIRIYAGKPFMIDEHITRLLNGLKTVRFKKLPSGLKVHSEKVIEANGIGNGVLRIEVTRGEASDNVEPTVVITAKETVPYAEELYTKGFRTIISKVRKDHYSPICNIKSANFQVFLLAKYEAVDAGVDEAILLNHEGFIAEGSVSNVFILKAGRLITPSIESGILPGITRKVVIEIAQKMGLKVEERGILPEELYSADEAFLTNSLMEVMPLVDVDKKPIGDGLPGKTTLNIHKSYKEMVREFSL